MFASFFGIKKVYVDVDSLSNRSATNTEFSSFSFEKRFPKNINYSQVKRLSIDRGIRRYTGDYLALCCRSKNLLLASKISNDEVKAVDGISEPHGSNRNSCLSIPNRCTEFEERIDE